MTDMAEGANMAEAAAGTLAAALDRLEADLEAGDPDTVFSWLGILSLDGGLTQWGNLARWQERPRARDLLCRLAAWLEAEAGALPALQVLEAADRCCTLTTIERFHALQLEAYCHSSSPFVRRLYRRAVGAAGASLLSRLSYLADVSPEEHGARPGDTSRDAAEGDSI